MIGCAMYCFDSTPTIDFASPSSANIPVCMADKLTIFDRFSIFWYPSIFNELPQKNFPMLSIELGASYTSKKLSVLEWPMRKSWAWLFVIHTTSFGPAFSGAFWQPLDIKRPVKMAINTRLALGEIMQTSKIVQIIAQPHKVWFGTTEKKCKFVLLCCIRCFAFGITSFLAFSPSGCRFSIWTICSFAIASPMK